MKKEQEAELRFSCPKCGGTMFGSSRQPDGSWVRHCSSDRGLRPCTMQFHQDDDWKYFVVIDVQSFESKDEFDVWYKERIQNGTHMAVATPSDPE